MPLLKKAIVSELGATSVAPSAGETLLMTRGVRRRELPGLRGRQRVPGEVLGGGRDARRVLRPGRQGGVGLKSSAPGPYQPKLPLTGAPSLVRFSEKAASAEDLSMSLLKKAIVSDRERRRSHRRPGRRS